MIEAIAETRERKTDFTAAPSWLAEWSGKQILSRLERRQDLSDRIIPDFFRHDTQSKIERTDVVVGGDFWEPRVCYVDIKVESATENTTRVRRTYDESLLEYRDAMSRFPSSLNTFEDEEAPMDWDSHIASTPPSRRSWTVKARFRYVGRSKPMQAKEL